MIHWQTWGRDPLEITSSRVIAASVSKAKVTLPDQGRDISLGTGQPKVL